MHSTELVPLTYARNAYNAIHGTALEAHNDTLTSEQEATITGHYDIELRLGTHAKGVPRALSNDPYAKWERPSELEYDEVAAVVGGMVPGDTLFLEGSGFGHPSLESPSSTASNRLSFPLTAERLEQARQDGSLSAWQYAKGLAELKGIATVYADRDAFEVDSLYALAGKGMGRLLRSFDEEERALGRRMHRQRELKARNTVKDWALAHLPAEGKPQPSCKPRLVLLWGAAHKAGLEQAFSDIGLDTKTTIMRSTSPEARTRELAQRLMSDVVVVDYGASLDPMRYPAEKGSILVRGERQHSEIGTISKPRFELPTSQLSLGKKTTLNLNVSRELGIIVKPEGKNYLEPPSSSTP